MATEANTFSDKISKLKMAHRILIFTGTIVVLIALYIWLIYIPNTKEIASIQSDLKKLEGQIRIAKIAAKNLKKLEKDLAKAQEDLKFALKLLPTTSEIPKLLKGITNLGNDSNLEFLLFRPTKQVSKKFYVEIPVSILVRGVYHDVAMFFDKVGKMDRIVNIVNVTMRPISVNSTILKTSCNALTYRFKEVKEVKHVGKKKK